MGAYGAVSKPTFPKKKGLELTGVVQAYGSFEWTHSRFDAVRAPAAERYRCLYHARNASFVTCCCCGSAGDK